MLEAFVKLRSQRLQLHPRLQTVRRFRALPDEAVNAFFDVDERLFHGVASLGRAMDQGKISSDAPLCLMLWFQLREPSLNPGICAK